MMMLCLTHPILWSKQKKMYGNQNKERERGQSLLWSCLGSKQNQTKKSFNFPLVPSFTENIYFFIMKKYSFKTKKINISTTS